MVRTLIYAVEHSGSYYTMIGASSGNDFNNYFRLFNSSMNGFRTLTDPSKLNKQPERIDIVTVQKQDLLSRLYEVVACLKTTGRTRDT